MRVVERLTAALCLFAATLGAQGPSRPGDTLLLSLPALVGAALRNNTDLRAAALNPRLAESDMLAARSVIDPSLTLGTDVGNTANDVFGVSSRATQSSLNNTATLLALLPTGNQLSFSVQNSRLASDPLYRTSAAPFATNHVSSLGLSFTQPLLRGLGRTGTMANIEATSISVDAAQQRYERSADITVALVERAYWTLRQAESNESVLRRSVDASRTIYERNVALRDRDVATTLDVLTSERGLATRETQLFEATRQRIDAADRLLVLVYGEDARNKAGSEAPRVHTAPDSVLVADVPSVDSAGSLALAQRGDARAARREYDASARRAAFTHNQRLPRLDLVASYAYGGTSAASRFLNYGDSTDIRNSTWTLGLSTSIFQRNDAGSAVDQRALAQQEIARVNQVATDNLVLADVRAAVRGLQVERARYLRARQVVDLAEREYAVAQEGARLGLVTTFQLLQYEDQLSQARLLVAQARFSIEDAGTVYRLAVGEGRRAYLTPPSR